MNLTPSNQHFHRRSLIEFWCQLLSKTMKDFRLKYYPRFVTLSHNGIPDWINFSIKSDLPLDIRRTIELTEQPFLRAAASQPFAFCQTVEQPQSQSPSNTRYISTSRFHLSFATQASRVSHLRHICLIDFFIQLQKSDVNEHNITVTLQLMLSVYLLGIIAWNVSSRSGEKLVAIGSEEGVLGNMV